MDEQQQGIIDRCREFARMADTLETKGFNAPAGKESYQEVGFVKDFNALFAQYCHGQQNRTASGLNFGSPPRYSVINSAPEILFEYVGKARSRVTFVGQFRPQTLRFVLDMRTDEWKLAYYETFVGTSPDGEDIWRKHRL